MKRFVVRTMLLALIAGAGLAACGDDDSGGGNGDGDATEETDGGDETDEGGEALSEEEFIEAGDEICANANEEIDAAGEELEEEFPDEVDFSDPEVQEAAAELIIPLVRDTVDQFRELEGPDELVDGIEEILAEIEELADEVEDDPSLLAGESPLGDFDEQWSDLGFEVCGADD
jgi:hypothetical protein